VLVLCYDRANNGYFMGPANEYLWERNCPSQALDYINTKMVSGGTQQENARPLATNSTVATPDHNECGKWAAQC
jgi:hypothetical protein